MPPKKKTTQKKVAAEAAPQDTMEDVQEEKKAAPRMKAKLATSGSGRFDIFASKEQVQQTRIMLAKANMADGFKTAGEIARDYLPVPHMALQYLINRIGIPARTIVEFIGQENVGKSSLVFYLLGTLVKNNVPCFYINCEPKMVEPDWMDRLFGEDTGMSERIKEVIDVCEQCATLNDMDKLIRQWVHVKRNEIGIAKDVPLCVVVDPYTKLLNPEEAELAVGNHMDKSGAVKGVAEISKKPAVFANWMHTWSRTIATPILERENVTLILVSGQNVKMDAGASSFAADGGASLNKTRPGGMAINQSAALQITVTRKGFITSSASKPIGKMVMLRCVKNSYGPDSRKFIYNLRNEDFVDGDDTKQQAIDMDGAFCDVLVENKVMGLTCTRKLYSSDQLDVHAATAAKLMQRINSDEGLRIKIGRALGISGYEADI